MSRRIIFLLAFFFLTACIGPRDLSYQNLASLYRPGDMVLHPEFQVYHTADVSSRLYIRLNPDELLFVRQPDDQYRASLHVKIQLITSYENTEVKDTGSADFSFDMKEKGQLRLFSCNFPVHSTGIMLLHIFLTDQNKNHTEDFYTNFNNSNRQVRQCYIATNKSGEILMKNFITEKDTVMITYRDSSVKNIWCKYYHRNFNLALPPFSFDERPDFNYHADSIFKVDLSDTAGIFLPKEGFYHFQEDSMQKDGFTIFRFDPGFPNVTNPGLMLESMRYLITRKEFDELKANANRKAAVDAFWLEKGGNQERTRLLIKKYYSRVQDANKYFTSFTDGWRTDRGMIYTIFGSPNSITRGAVSESWTYGTPNSTLALNLFFIKVRNPFSDNDFILARSPAYESNWFRAVDVWRQGRPYNGMN